MRRGQWTRWPGEGSGPENDQWPSVGADAGETHTHTHTHTHTREEIKKFSKIQQHVMESNGACFYILRMTNVYDYEQ